MLFNVIQKKQFTCTFRLSRFANTMILKTSQDTTDLPNISLLQATVNIFGFNGGNSTNTSTDTFLSCISAHSKAEGFQTCIGFGGDNSETKHSFPLNQKAMGMRHRQQFFGEKKRSKGKGLHNSLYNLLFT